MKDSKVQYIREKAINGLQYLDNCTKRVNMHIDMYDVLKLRQLYQDILFVAEKL